MPILNIQTNEVGQSGVQPRIVRIKTNDSVATVTTPGYLTSSVQKGLVSLRESDLLAIVTRETANSPETSGWFEVSYENGQWSVVPPAQPGSVELPTVANRLAHFTDTTGTLSDDSANVSHLGDLTLSTGDLILTAGGITSEDDVTINAGDLQVSNGSIRAGQGSSGGFIQSYSTDNSGILTLKAINNSSGNFGTIVNTAESYSQNQTLTIPDASAATANFLLDSGADNIISYEQFVGLESILVRGSGFPYSLTRISQGNYVYRHTGGVGLSIIGVDITNELRTALNKGLRLESFDVIYSITTDVLTAHTVTLDKIDYTDNSAVNVVSIPVTGILGTAVQANPYVTNVAIDTPEFNNTTRSKYVVEVNVTETVNGDYDFYGFVLKFSKTIA